MARTAPDSATGHHGHGQPKLRSRNGGAAIPLDESDKRLINLIQGSFPLEPSHLARRAWTAERSRIGLSPDKGLLDARIIREVTPIFDTRAIGYSRCSSPPRSTRSTRTARRR